MGPFTCIFLVCYGANGSLDTYWYSSICIKENDYLYKHVFSHILSLWYTLCILYDIKWEMDKNNWGSIMSVVDRFCIVKLARLLTEAMNDFWTGLHCRSSPFYQLGAFGDSRWLSLLPAVTGQSLHLCGHAFLAFHVSWLLLELAIRRFSCFLM